MRKTEEDGSGMWNANGGGGGDGRERRERRGGVSKPARGGCSQDECAGLYPDRFYRNVSPSLRLSTFGRACACAWPCTCRCDIVAAQRDPEIESIQKRLVDTTKNHCDTVRSSGYWL